MDEEDGRPEALAVQTGQLDASNDARAVSLRFSPSRPRNSQQSTLFMGRRSDGRNLCKNNKSASPEGPRQLTPPQGAKAIRPTAGGGGEKNENVSGK
jgi:hypothetical protein